MTTITNITFFPRKMLPSKSVGSMISAGGVTGPICFALPTIKE